MTRSIFTLLIIIQAVYAMAQEFPITHLGVEEGLGHSIAYRTFQSQDGYLWFSTDNGVTRYDGVNFKTFTTQDGLRSNFIFDIEERDSALLITTFGGGIMTYRDNVFRPYSNDSVSVRYPITLEFFQDQLWVIDRYKQLSYEKDGKFFALSAAEMTVENDDFIETYSVSGTDSIMFIGTSSGLFSFDGKKFVRYFKPELAKSNIYNVKMLRGGNLLVSTKHGLLEYDLAQDSMHMLLQTKYFSPSSGILEDHEGNIWISLINGETYLLKHSAGNSSRETIKVLEGVVVNQLFEDRERNVWLATYGEGAWCIRSIHVRNYPIRGCILSDLIVDPWKNKIVVSTINAGLKFFDQSRSGFLNPVTSDPLDPVFKHKKNIIAALQVSPTVSCFSSNNIFYQWKENKLDSLKVPGLISVLYHQKKKNLIWIGCRFGLVAYADGSPLKRFNGFDERVIRSITQDKNGNVLVGTDIGVFIETSNGFLPVPNENSFSNTYVNALFTDVFGTTWAGTNSGLAKIEKGRLEFVDYPLTKTRCNSITGDSKGRLWIGTVKGLLYFDHQRYQMITTKEGIAQSNVTKVVYQPETDLVTLMTSNGISVLDAENFLLDEIFELPNIIIEQITSGTRQIQYSSSMLELGKDQRDIRMVIATPMIKNRHKIIFTYRINDEPWTEFNGRDLALEALPFGELNLTVRAQEQYMGASEKSRTLALLLPRPFYFRWWFISLMVLLLSGTITLVVFSYSKRKNRKLIDENKRLDIEHKALKNLLNPHFLYNAINSIHAFILQNDQRKTLAYLSKFSQLVRLNLELLSADRVTLDKEIKNIGLYLEFEKLRFAEKLNYSIDIDSDIILSEVELPSFLIQPFLENAIWHGLLPREEGGKLSLRVSRLNDRLVITIEDNGVGINSSLKIPKADLEKKTSMGINIIQERIDLLRKLSSHYALMIKDKAELNGHDTGTVVTITVPI